MTLRARTASPADAAAITRIYNEGIEDRLGTFETRLRSAGFRIDKCLNGAQALERIDRDRYDIAILDIMMPGIDGYELLGHIRKRPSTRDLLVVLLSARSSQADIEKGLELGADLYITKPFDGAELARTLTLLSRARRSGNTALAHQHGVRR